MRPTTTIFLTLLGVTIAVWVLRGLSVLGFLPGALIWLLIFLTIGSGIFDIVQRTRRW